MIRTIADSANLNTKIKILDELSDSSLKVQNVKMRLIKFSGDLLNDPFILEASTLEAFSLTNWRSIR